MREKERVDWTILYVLMVLYKFSSANSWRKILNVNAVVRIGVIHGKKTHTTLCGQSYKTTISFI
jgi:hypothetical protein